ncbi:MAG: AAA family ATPase [Lachnospiraceae bacterium]|nr:AAA family ATPase [Lachnospiraceae bacterium]
MSESAYSNKELIEKAKVQYNTLQTFCKQLDVEGYWEQPRSILHKSVQEVLEMYVQAVLVNLAVYSGRFRAEEKQFISELTDSNCFGNIDEDDVSEDVMQSMNSLVKSPPILLQLCGVRDSEEDSDMTENFFDTFLNIMLCMAYLNKTKNMHGIKFIEEYYQRISVFINQDIVDSKINARYIFKKLSCESLDDSHKVGPHFEMVAANEAVETVKESATVVEDEVKNQQIKEIKEELEEIKQRKREAKLEEYLEELNQLVGLEDVKKEIHSLINLIKVRKMRESFQMPTMDMTYHMVFTGGPGTGKTTVARLVSKIYKELGILSEGTLVETDRAGLVAGYVGQTAIKVKEVVEKALGGVLFIDEAYALTNSSVQNDFGSEAIDTLVKMMEDNRDNLVVIVAGYNKEMKEFLESNTGLVSRFNKFIDFPDYSMDELVQIMNAMADKAGVQIDEEAIEHLRKDMAEMTPEQLKRFGNARGIRNSFEKIMVNQANRLVCEEDITQEVLSKICEEDINQVVRSVLGNIRS